MERRASIKLQPKAGFQPPSIRAFPSVEGVLKSSVKEAAHKAKPLKSELQLALPVIQKCNKVKDLRQTKAPLKPINELFRVSSKVSLFTPRAQSSLERHNLLSPRKLVCAHVEAALNDLIQKCGSRSPTSRKVESDMRLIEEKVRSNMQQIKAFFKQKDKPKPTYSERRRYWSDEPEMTHAQVKTMLRKLRVEALRTKLFV
jgi:hypothetical protein